MKFSIVLVSLLALGLAQRRPSNRTVDICQSHGEYQFAYGHEQFRLVSPGVPEGRDYDNYLDCQYQMRANIDLMVSVDFTMFDVELESSNCGYDFLAINHNKFCGAWPSGKRFQYIVFAGTTIDFRFHTDHSVLKRGFDANVVVAPYEGQDLTLYVGGLAHDTNQCISYSCVNCSGPDAVYQQIERLAGYPNGPHYYTSPPFYTSDYPFYNSTTYPWYNNFTTNYPNYYTTTYPWYNNNFTTDYPFFNTTHHPFFNTTHYPFSNTTHYPFFNTTHYPFFNTTAYPFYNTTHYPFFNTTAYPFYNTTAYPFYNTTAYPFYNTTAYPFYNTTAYPFYNTTAYPFYNTTTYPWYFTTTYSHYYTSNNPWFNNFTTNYPQYYTTNYPWYNNYTSHSPPYYTTYYPHYYSTTHYPHYYTSHYPHYPTTHYPYYYSTTPGYNSNPLLGLNVTSCPWPRTASTDWITTTAIPDYPWTSTTAIPSLSEEAQHAIMTLQGIQRDVQRSMNRLEEVISVLQRATAAAKK